jgi:hypothetical protein
MPPKKKPPAAAAPLKAQGTGGRKRTPTSSFDAAAGKDEYEPEKVIAERLARGSTQYQVKWANYESKHNTWEPIEHLAGCEDMIAEFKVAEFYAPAARMLTDNAAPESDTSAEPAKKHRKVSLGGLLGGSIKKEASPAPPATLLDELEQYLADPEEPSIDVKVLAWWKAKESKWPALAKMVKQYFAAPASSAGVERVFSAAGNMHGDLQKSAKDSTLEHSLFAAFNTD